MQSQKTIVKELIISFNLAFSQARGSYNQYYNLIYAIARDVLLSWIKRINARGQQFEIIIA